MASTTITTDYDGYATDGGTKVDDADAAHIGYSKTKYRTFLRFANDDLPAGTITQVQLKVWVSAAGGASHLCDIHAYESNGQEDPEDDTGAEAYARCASGNLYVDDNTDFRSTGFKTITLGGNVCTDLANARDAGKPFTLGLHEEGDNDQYARIDTLETLGGNPAQLIITYEAAPPAEGYSYSDGLVCVQVVG